MNLLRWGSGGNESEVPSMVLEPVYSECPAETCFYWFDLLIMEWCLMRLFLILSC